MPTDRLAARAAADAGRVHAFHALPRLLGDRLARDRPFEGLRVIAEVHLTPLVAAVLPEIALGGGEWVALSASEATADRAAAEHLRGAGIEVLAAGDRRHPLARAAEAGPDLVLDTGGALLDHLARARPDVGARLRGAVELTRSGVRRLDRTELPFGVVDLDGGALKAAVEKRHGVGEGLWRAVALLTGLHLAGRPVGVVGYGEVGRGVALRARAEGALVEVVEVDPVRRLAARFDGFATPSLEGCIGRLHVLVAATGCPGAVPVEVLRRAADGLVLAGAGHGADEIDVAGIRAASASVVQRSELVVEHRLEGGPRLVLLAGGHPLNIVAGTGSPEPVLVHFAVAALALARIALAPPLAPGLHPVGRDVEEEAARLALAAFEGREAP